MVSSEKWGSTGISFRSSSLLGLLLFFIYVSHISDVVSSNVRLFVDNI